MFAVLGADHLAPADKELLIDWMSANATGDTLIRAGAPTDWVVADKSGGAGPLRNDIAVVFADRKSTRLNSSHVAISYAVFCLKKKTIKQSPAATSTSKQTHPVATVTAHAPRA